MPPSTDSRRELHPAEIAAIQAETRKLDLESLALERHRALEESKSHYNKVYDFWGEVTNGTARACVEELGRWSRQYPGEPFTLVFNSPGGGVVPGLALFDYIQTLRANGHHITTVSIGWAASMGGILLQAGDTRVMGAHAWLMIHEVTSGAGGKTSEVEDEVKFTKRLQGQLLGILSSRSSFSQAQITTRWKRKDWFLDASEALAGGFIDEIR